jgi:hypothetical protein
MKKINYFNSLLDFISIDKNKKIFTLKSFREALMTDELKNEKLFVIFMDCFKLYLRKLEHHPTTITIQTLKNMRDQLLKEFNEQNKSKSVKNFIEDFEFKKHVVVTTNEGNVIEFMQDEIYIQSTQSNQSFQISKAASQIDIGKTAETDIMLTANMIQESLHAKQGQIQSQQREKSQEQVQIQEQVQEQVQVQKQVQVQEHIQEQLHDQEHEQVQVQNEYVDSNVVSKLPSRIRSNYPKYIDQDYEEGSDSYDSSDYVKRSKKRKAKTAIAKNKVVIENVIIDNIPEDIPIVSPNNFEDEYQDCVLMRTINKEIKESWDKLKDINKILIGISGKYDINNLFKPVIASKHIAADIQGWEEFMENQVYWRFYEEYKGKKIKKNLINKFSLPTNRQFKLNLMNLSSFGRYVFIVMINMVHEEELPPESRNYSIVPDVLDPQLYHSMKLFLEIAFETDKWRNILDHNGKDGQNDPRRKQIKIQDVCGNDYPIFLRDIKTVLECIFPGHHVWDEHLIISEEGVGMQCLHTDDQYGFTKILGKDDIMSYDAVIALDQEVEIRYAPSIDSTEDQCEIIKIMPFSMMIFCGNTVHSGTEWKEETEYAPRIHFYIDPPGRTHDAFSQSFIKEGTIEELKKKSSKFNLIFIFRKRKN